MPDLREIGSKPKGQTTTFDLGVAEGNVVVIAEIDQIREILEGLDDIPTAMRQIGAAMLELVDEAFAESRGPDGREWLPIKPESNAKREHPSTNPLPLQDTGALRASFRALPEEDGNAVSIGTNFGFYTYHQHDPDYPIDKHIMPTRAALPRKHHPLPDSWAEEILATLQDHLALLEGGGGSSGATP